MDLSAASVLILQVPDNTWLPATAAELKLNCIANCGGASPVITLDPTNSWIKITNLWDSTVAAASADVDFRI